MIIWLVITKNYNLASQIFHYVYFSINSRIKNKNDGKSLKKVKQNELIIDFVNPKNSFEKNMKEAYFKCKNISK